MSKVIDFREAVAELKQKLEFEQLENKIDDLDDFSYLRQTIDDTNDYGTFSLSFAYVIAKEVIESMEIMGYDIEGNPDTVFDIVSIVESVRALFHRASKQDYAYQAVADTVFDIDDPKEALDNILDAIRKEPFPE
jgi:hypothetical protein